MKKYSKPVIILGALNAILVLMVLTQAFVPARYSIVPDGNRFWWVDHKSGKLTVCSEPKFVDYAPDKSQPMENVYCVQDFWASYKEETAKR